MSYNLTYPNYQPPSGLAAPVPVPSRTSTQKVSDALSSIGKKVYKTEKPSDTIILTSLAALSASIIRPKIFSALPGVFDYLLKTTVGIGLFSLFGNIFTGHQQSYNLRKNNPEAYLQYLRQKSDQQCKLKQY